GLENIPIPELGKTRTQIVRLARTLDGLATERASMLSTALPAADVLKVMPINELVAAIAKARRHDESLLQRQVGLQEELDWLVYKSFGLLRKTDEDAVFLPHAFIGTVEIPVGARPFEILQARGGRIIGVD